MVSREFSDAQLKLIRRTVARSCTPAEFDEFMAVASLCGLDPLRRQISPLIISADDPDRRRLIPWTTIDGLRVIAARHGDYRPMEEAPIIEFDSGCIDERRNPLGIVRAEVRAWKATEGVWHPVAGEAWWDEFAPMRGGHTVAMNDQAQEGTDPKGSVSDFHLDPSWQRMGRVMIAKCAEAQALRRGWPDLLSGLYGAEELSAVRLYDRTASELLQLARDEECRRKKAVRTLWFTLKRGGSFEPVSVSAIENVVGAFYLAAETDDDIRRFNNDNCASLATYWEWMPAEALRLKQMSEAVQAALRVACDPRTGSRAETQSRPRSVSPPVVRDAGEKGEEVEDDLR
jgi:phage recombination protein Bet